jgi:ribosomal protein L29
MADKTTTKIAPAKAEKSKKVAKATEVKTLEQLRDDLKKVQNDLQESRRSHLMGELVNPHVLTVQRKEVARVLTAIKQAEIATAKSETKEEN